MVVIVWERVVAGDVVTVDLAVCESELEAVEVTDVVALSVCVVVCDADAVVVTVEDTVVVPE